MIKYKYIVQLIQAHFTGDEMKFWEKAETDKYEKTTVNGDLE